MVTKAKVRPCSVFKGLVPDSAPTTLLLLLSTALLLLSTAMLLSTALLLSTVLLLVKAKVRRPRVLSFPVRLAVSSVTALQHGSQHLLGRLHLVVGASQLQVEHVLCDGAVRQVYCGCQVHFQQPPAHCRQLVQVDGHEERYSIGMGVLVWLCPAGATCDGMYAVQGEVLYMQRASRQRC